MFTDSSACSCSCALCHDGMLIDLFTLRAVLCAGWFPPKLGSGITTTSSMWNPCCKGRRKQLLSMSESWCEGHMMQFF